MKKVLLSVFMATSISSMAQNVSIPDANFKAALVANTSINTNNDGEITVNEAAAFAGSLDVSSKSISNLTGIEAFTNIVSLACYSNNLTQLDLSKNTALKYLYAYSNKLTSIDVSKNTALVTLYCYGNKLTQIDISKNSNLVYFDASTNDLTSIDLSNNPKLSKIYCHSNKLSAIDVSKNPALRLFFCYNNGNISSIDVSKNPQLSSINCGGNKLTRLDLSQNPGLTKVYCAVTQMTFLNLANGQNKKIVEIEANANGKLDCVQVDDVAYSTAVWKGNSYKFDSASSFSKSCAASSTSEVNSVTFQITPNPVANTLTVQGLQEDITQLGVYDISGKLLIKAAVQNSVDVSTLSSGIYLVSIKTASGVSRKKFVKH